MVRLLAQEGELAPEPSIGSGRAEERDSWSVRIPQGVREVIGRRLDRLSQRCNETLTIASVIGREFTLAQLKAIVQDPAAGSEQVMTEDRLWRYWRKHCQPGSSRSFHGLWGVTSLPTP